MILEKQEWDNAVSKWLIQKKKHSRLMYAHFLISIPMLLWIMTRVNTGDYELNFIGGSIVNVSFLFGILIIITFFQIEKQRKYLIASHKMLSMIEKPKNQWGFTEDGNKTDA